MSSISGNQFLGLMNKLKVWIVKIKNIILK